MAHLSAEEIAAKIRTAVEAVDLEPFADLLDPSVTWGAPGDQLPSCRDRRQVLEWYRQRRTAGRRVRVRDVVANADKILVAMSVSAPDSRFTAEPADRWQVLTVSGGLIVDIRGYDAEVEARAAAGLAQPA